MDTILGSLFTILTGILVLLLLAVVLYSSYIAYTRSKYSHIPCPQPVNFFLGHIPSMQKASKNDGNMQLLYCKWAETYGSTFVVFFMHEILVVTINPDSVKELMITGNFPKSRRYKIVSWRFGQRVLGSGLVTELDHENWTVRRLGMNRAFHRTVLKNLIDEFNTTTDELVRVLGSQADNNSQLELAPLMHKTTLDVIGKVAFGKDLGSLQKEVSPFVKATFDMMFILTKSIQDPLLSLPFRGQDYKATLKEAMTVLRKTGKEWLTEREEASKRGDYIPEDILTHMLRLRESTDIVSDEILLDDFITFFVAGQETTANTVSFMLLELGRHPEIFKRLQEEVDKVIGQKPLVSFEDVSKLEYMSMVWKETLRMYAIAPVSFRDIDRDGYKIDGYDIPRDTIVMMSSFMSSRSPSLISDPLTFNPERFAPNSEDKPNTYAYFPFALGPRSCIGQTFAQLEGKVLVAKILQNFNYELDPSQSFGILEASTLKPKDGVRARVSWRKSA